MELPEGMNIHPVFHKSLLEKALPGAKPGPVAIHEETQEPMYDVESIVAYRPRREDYLMKWQEYEDTENT